jgi:hypothetical protein
MRIRDKRHLSVVARLPSIISGKKPVEVCHVRYGDPRYNKPPAGMGEKPDDKWVLPLTPEEHRLSKAAQHTTNERFWWSERRIDPLAVCEKLYAVWQKTGNPIEAEQMMESIILRIMAFRM